MMRKPAAKATYRIRNWAEYNRALVRRGSLTVWVDQEALDAWNHQGPPRWGAKFVYSDTAIQCLLTIRAVFHLPLRATQGMAQSVFELMGLDLEVPHYSTLSRRAAALEVDLARKSKGPLYLVLDGTGLKVYGEGEGRSESTGIPSGGPGGSSTWPLTPRRTRSRRSPSPRPGWMTPRRWTTS